MRFFAALAFLPGISLVLGGEPPKPNLDDPVDYITWVNREYGGSIKVNAAEKYRQAFAAYVAPSEQVNEKIGARFEKLWRTEARGQNAVGGWVGANKRSLRFFSEATQMGDCYFPRSSTSGMLIDALYPHTAYFRTMRILLRVRAGLRFDTGNVDGAVGDVCVILRSAQHLYRQPSMVEYVAATSTARVAYDTVRDWLADAHHPIDHESIIARLRREDRPPATPRRHLLIGKVQFWDVIQRARDDPVQGIGLDTQRSLDVAVVEVQRIYTLYERLYLEEYAKATKLNDKLQEEVEHVRENMNLSREGEVAGTSVRLLASVSAPSLWSSALHYRTVFAERNATYVLLAMHAYKAKHGREPTSLAEITPGDLSGFRTDPFSGNDLVYHIDGGQPVLYSVGLNGKDDGGKRGGKPWADTGDEVFWPPQKH